MRLGVSNHAVERYVERVKPQLGEAQAREELEALVALAEPCARPWWVKAPIRRGDAYLRLAPDVIAAVKGRRLVATILRAPERAGGERRAARKRRRELHRWKENVRVRREAA